MDSIEKQLRNLDLSNVKLDSGRTMQDELARHARILQDCIRYSLQKTYVAYSPVLYQRSFRLLESIKCDVLPQIEKNGSVFYLSVSVYFDNNAFHRGLDGRPADVATLLNEGWQTHGSFQNVPYFGFRAGEHFIESGIDLYKRTMKEPFQVSLLISGQERIL